MLVPSNIDQLQNRLREDKNTLNVVWKRINDKRLPPIPKSVLSVRDGKRPTYTVITRVFNLELLRCSSRSLRIECNEFGAIEAGRKTSSSAAAIGEQRANEKQHHRTFETTSSDSE